MSLIKKKSSPPLGEAEFDAILAEMGEIAEGMTDNEEADRLLVLVERLRVAAGAPGTGEHRLVAR